MTKEWEMLLRTSVAVTGPSGWSTTGPAFVDRTPDELAAAIDTLIARPDLTIERDGMLGDKGYISIYKGRATIHLYFPKGDEVRYEYADPSDGIPGESPKVSSAGFLSADDAKEAVRMMAREDHLDSFFRARTKEGG
jgi:hypothetical protein